MRKPAAPRSNQKRRMRSNSSTRSGFHQLRSGCSGTKWCRYHWPVASSKLHAGPPKRALPVVREARRRAPGVGPHVPVAVGGVTGGAGVEEPRVLVARVVRDQVDQHADVPLRRGGDQLVEVGQRAERRVDVAVVGDVVAPVLVRRDGDRVQPDGVDAQPLQVVQVAGDARAGRRCRRRSRRRTTAGRSGR